MREGDGKLVYADSKRESYDGEFSKDKIHGIGRLKFKNGDEYYGTFKKGKKD